MRRMITIGLCVAGLGLTGCGSGLPAPPAPTTAPSKVGPHGGMAFPMLEGQAYAEVVNEPPIEDRRSNSTTAIVVYFLGMDAKESATTVPAEVKFVLDLGRGSTRVISLKAEPKTGDPAGGARFVSEMGPYRVEDLRGDLTADVGGKPAKVSLLGGR
jgi:hypothetical protein